MFPCHKIIHPLFIFLILSGLCSCKAYQPAAKAFEKEGYKLVWADEFNKDGAVNSNNWQFEKGFMRNQEFQWYQEDNAWCEKGFLIIEGRREQKPNPVYQAGSTEWRKKNAAINYTSSSIKTSGKHSWQYGRFIMRGRINIDAGLWPAWWTLGVKGPWPSNGEIDIIATRYWLMWQPVPANPIKQNGLLSLSLLIPWEEKNGLQNFIPGGWIGMKEKFRYTWMMY
jgi:hypothetical protein